MLAPGAAHDPTEACGGERTSSRSTHARVSPSSDHGSILSSDLCVGTPSTSNADSASKVSKKTPVEVPDTLRPSDDASPFSSSADDDPSEKSLPQLEEGGSTSRLSDRTLSACGEDDVALPVLKGEASATVASAFAQHKIRLLVVAAVSVVAGVAVCLWAVLNAIDGGTSNLVLVAWLQLGTGIAFMFVGIASLAVLATEGCQSCCSSSGTQHSRNVRVDIMAEILMHALFLVTVTGFLCQFYIADFSIIFGPVHLIILVNPTLAILVCRRWWGIVGWGVISVIAVVVALLYEIFTPQRLSSQIENYIADPERNLAALYTCATFPYFVGFCAFLFVHFEREKEHRLTLRIAQAISKLQFDDVGIQKLRSKPASRCSETETVLRETLKNMEMYSRFLPEHLKQQVESDGAGLSTASGAGALSSVASRSSRSDIDEAVVSVDAVEEAGDSDTATVQSNGSSVFSKGAAVPVVPKGALKNFAAFRVGLEAKNGTVLIADVRGMHRRLRDSPKRTLDYFNEMVDGFAMLVKKFGGVVDGIAGDKCVATWNLVRNSVMHQRNAVFCANELCSRVDPSFLSSEPDAVKESEETRPPLSSRRRGLQLVVTVVSGDMLHGNVGNQVKRYVNLGWPCSCVYALKTAQLHVPPRRPADLPSASSFPSREWEKSTILIDESVRPHVKYAFETRTVAIVEHQGETTRIYRLGKRVAEEGGENKEWMYAIAQQLRGQRDGSVTPAGDSDGFAEKWKGLWSRIRAGDSREVLVALEDDLRRSAVVTRDRMDVDLLFHSLKARSQ